MQKFFSKLKKKKDLYLCCFSISFLSFVMAFSLKYEDSIQMLQEVVSKDIQSLEMNSKDERFQNLKKLIEMHKFSPATLDIVFGNELMNDFPSRFEAFDYYASKVILNHPDLTSSEKEEVISLIHQNSFRFGEYYSAETIFRTLIEFQNVPIIREDNLEVMTFTHDFSYGEIRYDSSWKNSYVSLFHELIHSIWNNTKINHYYNEVSADILSGTHNYQNATALMMMISKLGNEEEVLLGMINHNSELIWKNLKERFPNDERVCRLQEILESRKFADEVSGFCQSTDEELILIIEELYEEKYQQSMNLDIRMQILKNIFLDPNYFASLDDSFFLDGRILVNFHLGGFTSKVTILDDGSYTYQDFKKNILFLVKMNLLDERRRKIPYYESAEYFLKHLFGFEVYEAILYSSNPEEILDAWNEERVQSLESFVTMEHLKDIIILTRCGRGRDILSYPHLRSFFPETFELHYRKKVK